MKGRNPLDFFNLRHLHGGEIYLLVVLLVFGISVCFFLPVGGGYDEEQHLMRVWEMSSFTFLPNEKLGNEMPFPRIFWDMSYRREFIVRAVPPDFRETYAKLSLDAQDYMYSIKTRSVYAPPLLLPQALVMRYLGRSLQWPALTVYYACRLIGLFCYAFLAWLAVRLVPFGKWVMAILASSPVAILQAATISPDSISNGIALLFIGGSLALAARPKYQWKHWLWLCLLFLILFWGKINILSLALLPFVIMRPSRFQMRFGYVLLLGVAISLFLVEVLGWNLIAYSRYYDALEGADPLGQVRFILGDPLGFIGILGSSVWVNLLDLLYAGTAIYPFGYWPVPIWVYLLYFAGLLAALLLGGSSSRPDARTRIGLGIVFIATYLGTFASLYLSYTPVGSESVQGVQGRYLTALMPLLFLALARLPVPKGVRLPAFVPVALVGAGVAMYTAGMYLSYHVTCGSQYYQPGLCYQPNYKNWAPDELNSEPISQGLSLTQEIVSECGGMTELRVLMDATGADPEGSTELVLRDFGRDSVISSAVVRNQDLPVGGWFVLDFPPVRESLGRLYLLEVHHVSGGTGPRLAYSVRPEYLEGKLLENDQPVLNDLLFQAGCVAGWDAVKEP